MKKEVDARGKACPEPVVLTKKALEEADELLVIVNDPISGENVKRFATSKNCLVQVEHRERDIYLSIRKPLSENDSSPTPSAPASGPLVLAIASDRMGSGDDELGLVLMRSFIHALNEASEKPDAMVLFNTGVKLAVHGSEVLEDLRSLCQAGMRMLVCGTCLGFFEIKNRLAVGQISNMYDITEAMLGAGKLVRI